MLPDSRRTLRGEQILVWVFGSIRKLPEKHDANDERAFSYMGLSPGQSTYDIPVQHVFIESCTNSGFLT